MVDPGLRLPIVHSCHPWRDQAHNQVKWCLTTEEGAGGGAVSTASIVEVLGLGLSDATATQVEGTAPGVTPLGDDDAATLR